MKSANEKDRELAQSLSRRTGVTVSLEDARALRRAELTLQRWGEGECGDSGPSYSWAIERDEDTGKPFRVVYPHDGKPRRYPIADREAGALRRIDAICKRLGLHFYHQTDPRGCALYVASEPLTDSAYTNGVACCG